MAAELKAKKKRIELGGGGAGKKGGPDLDLLSSMGY